MMLEQIKKIVDKCETCHSIKDANAYAGLDGYAAGYCCESLLEAIRYLLEKKKEAAHDCP